MFGVWMFEKQTEEEKLSLKKITERIDLHYKEDKKSLQWWSIQIARASNNLCCFLVCFAMVQVMLSLWYLFIEFLGSYSRCRMSNGVMPCVLGPTNFYLKFWVNILTIRMVLCSSGCTSECCRVLHQNVDVHQTFIWVHHIWMNTWVSGFIICISYDFLGKIH